MQRCAPAATSPTTSIWASRQAPRAPPRAPSTSTSRKTSRRAAPSAPTIPASASSTRRTTERSASRAEPEIADGEAGIGPFLELLGEPGEQLARLLGIGEVGGGQPAIAGQRQDEVGR